MNRYEVTEWQKQFQEVREFDLNYWRQAPLGERLEQLALLLNSASLFREPVHHPGATQAVMERWDRLKRHYGK